MDQGTKILERRALQKDELELCSWLPMIALNKESCSLNLFEYTTLEFENSDFTQLGDYC